MSILTPKQFAEKYPNHPNTPACLRMCSPVYMFKYKTKQYILGFRVPLQYFIKALRGKI